MESSSASEISLNSSSKGKNGMDIEQQLHREALIEERRIQRLMGYDESGSRSRSDRSLGSTVSSKSSSGKLAAQMGEEAVALRLQNKIVSAFQHYADKTAVRAIMYLKMVADPTTILIKSVVQDTIHKHQDPSLLISSIKGLKYAPEYYIHFTDRDQQGFYVLGHIYYYYQYKNVLGPYEEAFVSNMITEILNSMGNTALFKQYFAFLEFGKEQLDDFGITQNDVTKHLVDKFRREFDVLANLFVSLPVHITLNDQKYTYSFPDVIMMVLGNLQIAHPTFVHQISTYFTNIEAQVRQCCIHQGGNNDNNNNNNNNKLMQYNKVGGFAQLLNIAKLAAPHAQRWLTANAGNIGKPGFLGNMMSAAQTNLMQNPGMAQQMLGQVNPMLGQMNPAMFLQPQQQQYEQPQYSPPPQQYQQPQYSQPQYSPPQYSPPLQQYSPPQYQQQYPPQQYQPQNQGYYGGNKKPLKKFKGFHFPRFAKVGPRKKLFKQS